MFSLVAAAALALTLAQPDTFAPPETGTVPLSQPIPAKTGTVPVSQPRPMALTTMYLAFAGLQTLDVHSTLRGLSNGGREANPAMKGLVRTPAALVGVKAAAGVTTIWMTEKMRKKHPRGAVVLMAVLNSALATVVAHNYRVR